MKQVLVKHLCDDSMDASAAKAAAALDSDCLEGLEAALATIELQSKDSDKRAGLSCLAGHLARRLERGANETLAIRLVEVLSTLSRDEAARSEAVEYNCVSTLVSFLCTRTDGSMPDELHKLRMAAVKALVNFTQGSCKERESVWICIRPLIELQDPELQRYGLMALANLATGSEPVQARLMQHRIGLAAGNVLAAKEMDLLVATQALRVLLPLSTSAHRAELVQEDVLIDACLAILSDRTAYLGEGRSPAERAMSAQVYGAILTLAFNLTGVAREELLEKGLAGALVRVVENEVEALHASESSFQQAEMALKGLYNMCRGSDACASRVVAGGLLSVAASLFFAAASPCGATRGDVDGGAEAGAARLVRCKLLVLQCIARAAQRPSVHPVLLDSGQAGPSLHSLISDILVNVPDTLSSMDLERVQRRGAGDEGDWPCDEDDDDGGGEEQGGGPAAHAFQTGVCAGEGDVLDRALFIVLALSKLSEMGLAWVCEGLVDPLVHVANTCQGRLQGMALGSLLLVSRGPPAMRMSLLALPVRGKHGGSKETKPPPTAPRVLACILSVMRVEAGQAQLTALKMFYQFVLEPKVHGHLLQHGATEPLIECVEVCTGQVRGGGGAAWLFVLSASSIRKDRGLLSFPHAAAGEGRCCACACTCSCESAGAALQARDSTPRSATAQL